jgi:beta-lactamase class A
MGGCAAAVFCLMVAGLAEASDPNRVGDHPPTDAGDEGQVPPQDVQPSALELLSMAELDVLVERFPSHEPIKTRDERADVTLGPVAAGPLASTSPAPVARPEPAELSLSMPPVTPRATPPIVDPGPTDGELEVLLQELVAEIEGQSAGVVASISVSSAELQAGVAADTSFVAASVAKLFWTVAAVDAVGPGLVSAHVEAVFGWSDNEAAGLMIDLVGVDAINAYTTDLGLDRTYLSSWDYGKDRYANDRSARGGNNTTSTGDLVSFLDQLAAGQLLSAEATGTVLGWMTAAPDRLSATHPYGAALVDALPAVPAAFASHKAGWLPPGCCTLIGNVLTAAGLIPLGDGSMFTIAIALADGVGYDAQVQWAGEATCRVWALLSEADHVDCSKTESAASL